MNLGEILGEGNLKKINFENWHKFNLKFKKIWENSEKMLGNYWANWLQIWKNTRSVKGNIEADEKWEA